MSSNYTIYDLILESSWYTFYTSSSFVSNASLHYSLLEIFQFPTMLCASHDAKLPLYRTAATELSYQIALFSWRPDTQKPVSTPILRAVSSLYCRHIVRESMPAIQYLRLELLPMLFFATSSSYDASISVPIQISLYWLCIHIA